MLVPKLEVIFQEGRQNGRKATKEVKGGRRLKTLEKKVDVIYGQPRGCQNPDRFQSRELSSNLSTQSISFNSLAAYQTKLISFTGMKVAMI